MTSNGFDSEIDIDRGLDKVVAVSLLVAVLTSIATIKVLSWGNRKIRRL